MEGIKDDNGRIYIFMLFQNVAKVTIIFIKFICPSVLIQQLASTVKNFCAILCWGNFAKLCRQMQVLLKSDKNNRHFTQRHNCVMLTKKNDFSN